MLIKLAVRNIFILLGISGLFIFLEISVARSSSIEEKRCGGKLFSSRCVLNAEILIPHFWLLFHLLHSLIFILPSKCCTLVIYTCAEKRDVVTTGFLIKYPSAITDLWDKNMFYWMFVFSSFSVWQSPLSQKEIPIIC